MKRLKISAAVVLLLVLLAVGGAYLTPRQVHVERSVVIEAPAEVIFAKVNDLREWHEWSTWHALEPDATYEYSGPDSGVGAKSEWKGELVGQGTQEITLSEPHRRITTELDFMEQGTATSEWRFDETGGRTRVTWGFETDMGLNPVSRYMGLMMDSMLGPDYEQGLENLRRVCEADGTVAASDSAAAGSSAAAADQ